MSWYEVAAYCAWLTAQGHDQGWLPDSDEIRLLASLEWERAARHSDRRRYPWGDAEPDSERANYVETGIDAPAPVGCFPRGAGVCGALDIAGNVDEWTATPDGERQQVEPQKDFAPDARVVLRLSAYYTEKNTCAAAPTTGTIQVTVTTAGDFGCAGPDAYLNEE
ncbi:MAG: formylglycine-generating enzyme family protein [Chloroflexales bacterium]|nr:formylglycine-generating enzyme family protein [Chloroflexales bacterium]